MPPKSTAGTGAGNPNKLASSSRGERSFLRTPGGSYRDHIVAVELPRADEVADGIPEPTRPESPGERGPDGRFLPGNATSARGGRGKVGAIKLARRVGLHGEAIEKFRPYERNAEDFRRHEVNRLAKVVGGGYCGASPAAIVAHAAREMAMAAYCFDLGRQTGDVDMFVKSQRIGDAARQNLLAAHELCVREAKSRNKSRKSSALDVIDAEVARQEAESYKDDGDDEDEASEEIEQDESEAETEDK